MPIGEKIRIYYDALGRVVRTVNPDSSEQRVVFGVPQALDTPQSYTLRLRSRAASVSQIHRHVAGHENFH